MRIFLKRIYELNLLKAAFSKSFWKISYAKKPDKVPENWRRIIDPIGLEATEENPFSWAIYFTGGKTVIEFTSKEPIMNSQLVFTQIRGIDTINSVSVGSNSTVPDGIR